MQNKISIKYLMLLFITSLTIGCNEQSQPYNTAFVKYVASNPSRAGGSFLPIATELENRNIALLSLVQRNAIGSLENTATNLFYVITILDPNGNKLKEKVLEDLPNALPISQGEFTPLVTDLLKNRCGGFQQIPNGLISVVGSVVDTILGNPIGRTFIKLVDAELNDVFDVDLRAPSSGLRNEGLVGATLVESPTDNSLIAFSSFNRFNNVNSQFNYELFFAKALAPVVGTLPDVKWIKIYGDENDQDLACKILHIPNTKEAIWTSTSFGNNKLMVRLGRITGDGAIKWTKILRGNNNENLAVSDIFYYGNSIMLLGCQGSDLSNSSKVYLANFDLEGNLNWNKILNIDAVSAYGMQIAISSDLKLVISGHSRKRTDDDLDMFLVKIDQIGNIIWQRVYQTNGEDLNSGVLSLRDGSFCLFGSSFPSSTTGLISLIKTNSDGMLSK
jgi:hypothetical protein